MKNSNWPSAAAVFLMVLSFSPMADAVTWYQTLVRDDDLAPGQTFDSSALNPPTIRQPHTLEVDDSFGSTQGLGVGAAHAFARMTGSGVSSTTIEMVYEFTLQCSPLCLGQVPVTFAGFWSLERSALTSTGGSVEARLLRDIPDGSSPNSVTLQTFGIQIMHRSFLATDSLADGGLWTDTALLFPGTYNIYLKAAASALDGEFYRAYIDPVITVDTDVAPSASIILSPGVLAENPDYIPPPVIPEPAGSLLALLAIGGGLTRRPRR